MYILNGYTEILISKYVNTKKSFKFVGLTIYVFQTFRYDKVRQHSIIMYQFGQDSFETKLFGQIVFANLFLNCPKLLVWCGLNRIPPKIHGFCAVRNCN